MKSFSLLFLACTISYSVVNAQGKPVVINGKLMYLSTLSPVVTQEYSQAEVFDNGLITIKTQNGWKLIDYWGKEIEDSRSVTKPEFSDGVAVLNEGGLRALRHRIMDENGEIISIINARTITPFINGAACYKHDNLKFGLINKQGEEIIKAQYDDCDEIFVVNNQRYYKVQKEDNWGLIDDNNEIILPFKQRFINHIKDEFFLRTYLDQENPTKKNQWGREVTNYIYSIWSIKKGDVFERKISDASSVSSFLDYDKHIVRFQGETDWSIVDFDGNTILTYPIVHIRAISEKYLAIGKKQDEDSGPVYAISDYNLNEKTPYTISWILPIEHGFIPFCISENNRTGCGYVDENLQLKIPLNYTGRTYHFEDDGRAEVGNKHKNPDGYTTNLIGIINEKNEIIIPPIFHFITRVSDEYYKVVEPENYSFDELIRYKDGSPVFKRFNSIYRKYGKYYGSVGDFQKALVNFQKLDSQTIEDKLNIGIAYHKLGQPEQALTYLNQITNLKNSDVAVLALAERGEIYLSSNNIEAGKKDFEKAFSESNNNTSIKMRYGVALQKVKLFDESIQQLNDVISLYPQAAEAYEYLGIAQAEKNLLTEAVESITKAIQFNANKISLYYFRGQIYMMNNQPLKAISDYEQAIKMTGSLNPSGYHIRLADAYELSGNRAKACELWTFLAPHSEASKTNFEQKCGN